MGVTAHQSIAIQRKKERAGKAVKGFRGRKRAGGRRREFRELPPKVQEASAGTDHATLRRVYDRATVTDRRRKL